MNGIMITGASGFLGKNLVKNLLVNSEYNLFLTEHKQPLKFIEDENLTRRVNILKLESKTAIREAFENNKISQVVHSATVYGRSGESKEQIINCNIVLPLKILEIGKANGLEHFVNIDTYFNKFTNEMRYLLDYTSSKKSLNNWFGSFSDSIRISNLMVEHMYGPGDSEDKFVSILINETINGFKSNLKFSPGNQTRDFVFVEDVAQAIVHILKLDKSKLDRHLNLEIGTGISYTLIQLFDIVQKNLGTAFDSPFGTTKYRENEIMASLANTQILSNLGWRAKIDLPKGINRTIQGISEI